MKKKGYLSFAVKRIIAGLIIGVIIFASLSAYLKDIYQHSVIEGFDKLSDKYRDVTERYVSGQIDTAFIDIITNYYNSDYVRFASVNEDGSFETIYETDYDVIPVEFGIRNWIYITKDQELINSGARTDNISGNDWMIEYKSCDEIWNLGPSKCQYLTNSWNLTSFAEYYNYGMIFYRATSELSGAFQYSQPWVQSYYVDGDTLHLGKVFEGNGYGGKKPGGQKWDFTDPSIADQYTEVDSELMTCVIFQMIERPSDFLEQNKDIFYADSLDDLGILDPDTDGRVVSFADDYREYYASDRTDGRLTQGKLFMFKVDGKWYVVEHVITTAPFAEFFRPMLTVIGIILFVLCIGIALIAAIKPYLQYKKAYENNLFKNNLIDSLAHNLKTPLQILGGYAENLKDTNDEADKNRYADQILAKTSEMNKDIEAILKTADKTSITVSPASIRKCIEETASKAGLDADIKGDAEYKIEKDYFNTALFCLLDNAARYKTAGSKAEVNITSKAVTITNKTASDKFTPGTGIAIAGRILEQHKLKLTTCLKDGVFEVKISTK